MLLIRTARRANRRIGTAAQLTVAAPDQPQAPRRQAEEHSAHKRRATGTTRTLGTLTADARAARSKHGAQKRNLSKEIAQRNIAEFLGRVNFGL